MSGKIFTSIILMLASSNAFAEIEAVTNGGDILQKLIKTCDIVGISNSGAANYVGYYFKSISPVDVVAVVGNSITIRNVTADDYTSARPRIITLTLNRIERMGGAPIRYYISGAYAGRERFAAESNSPDGVDGDNLILGSLNEIEFSPTDVIKKDGERGILRGKLTYLKLNTQTDEVTFPSDVFNKKPITFTWDLATPSNINKSVFCAGRQ